MTNEKEWWQCPVSIDRGSGWLRSLAPSGRRAIVQDDGVAHAETVVQGANVDVGRGRELLIDVEKELILDQIELHELFEPLDDEVNITRTLEHELVALENRRVANMAESDGDLVWRGRGIGRLSSSGGARVLCFVRRHLAGLAVLSVV